MIFYHLSNYTNCSTLKYSSSVTMTIISSPSSGGAVVRRRTRDRKLAGSTPGRGAVKSTRSTQPSIPPGSVNQVPACMAGVKAGCVHFVSGSR